MLATAIPERGLRLYSTYVGGQYTDSIAVHLELGTDRERPLAVRHYPHGELPVVHARHRCWLEHAAHLQQFVAELTNSSVAIDVAPRPMARRTAPTSRCRAICGRRGARDLQLSPGVDGCEIAPQAL
jgi:hypothetical protein